MPTNQRIVRMPFDEEMDVLLISSYELVLPENREYLIRTRVVYTERDDTLPKLQII
jgi:hypothetical protein